MTAIQKRIWLLALPYLNKGVRKDFVLHTKMVLHGLKLISSRVKCDQNILIPAAILHDTGWSMVPVHLQRATDKQKVKEAMLLHLEYSVPIIKKILSAVNFDKDKTGNVTDIVLSHKFRNPRNPDKRLLIDADTLSDIFKEAFYKDAKMYGLDPWKLYQIRMKNTFYTEAAGDIFRGELKNRAREIASLGDPERGAGKDGERAR